MLEVENVSGGYGEVDVLNDVSLGVAEREVVAIAGTNGSGKSTLGKALVGLLPRCTGRIAFEGVDIIGRPTHSHIGHGLCYVPQVANVFGSLSVLENLKVLKVPDKNRRIEDVFERFPGLAERRTQSAGSLSGGERQQLAMSRALVAGARLMVLDEPTANLAPSVIDQVLDIIAALPEAGVSVLLIEQRAREAFEISSRGYVMHLGNIVAQGTPSELLDDDALNEMFFGVKRGDGSAE